MHVLTKIFVVLVSLLAVVLVPLVVVYAHNENSYKARYLEMRDQANANQAELTAAQASYGDAASQAAQTIGQLTEQNRQLIGEVDSAQGEISRLQARLAAADSLKIEIESKLASLDSHLATAVQTNSTLLDQSRRDRMDAQQAERRRAEIDEQLRDVQSQLDQAVHAQRVLQEELQLLRDAQAAALTKINMFVARYGDIGDAVGEQGLAPDVTLTATVVGVQRSAVRTLVEIDAGSTSGVREGWIMTIGSPDGTFVGSLRITEVDINRSVGVLTLENPEARVQVAIGHRAYAHAGRR